MIEIKRINTEIGKVRKVMMRSKRPVFEDLMLGVVPELRMQCIKNLITLNSVAT